MTQKERLRKLQEQQNPLGAVLSHIQYIKGDQGEKGDPGPIGPQGPQGEPGESIIGPQGERGADGRNGLDGVDGRDGKDGKDGNNGRDGKDGKDVDPQEIIDAVLAQITTGKKVKLHDIEGLPQSLTELRDFLRLGGFRGGGGGSSTTTAASWHTITGTIDGLNTSFTIPSGATTLGSLLQLNGATLTPTTDYAIAGTTLTYVIAPPSGSTHLIFF